MKSRAIQICFVLIVASAAVGAFTPGPKGGGRSQKVERTIAADPSVTVSICVMAGSISVHGWDKNEVSAQSSDAAQIELRQQKVDAQSGKAMKVEVFVVDKSDEERIKSNCQASSELELFVPRTASVHVQTRDGDISIADIAVVVAGTQNGDISIENISHAVEVGSVGGSISIKDAAGRASLTTIGGGIEVVNLRPSASGDVFEAVSVSGDLNLVGVSHSRFSARTVTGDVYLTGPLAAGGRYGFKTMSGDITLTLPYDSSFNLSAKVSKDGEIISDFPLTLIPDAIPPSALVPPTPAERSVPPKSPAPPLAPAPEAAPIIVKVAPRMSKVIVSAPITVSTHTLRRVNAKCGAGDASIQVASFNGTLHLVRK
ncbi:hypothetical protein BH18ACI4_BH18ACI4_04840 [soil metagenome]